MSVTLRPVSWFAFAAFLAACSGRHETPDADAASNDLVVVDATMVDDAPDAIDASPDVMDVAPDVFVEPAPRAIAPMASATVTSQRPTFHFVLPAGMTVATVEICTTRDCATVEQTLPASGSSVQASGALAPGVHFWRLRNLAYTSPPWWFWVPVHSAAVDTSWGSEPDVDGDGLPEILVGANHAGDQSQGRAYAFPGVRGGYASAPTTTMSGTVHDGHFGWWLASAGDVNGDGFVDVVVGAPDVGIYSGRVYIFLGSASGLRDTPDTTLLPPENMGNFGSVVASAGDVNGDGFADVIAGAPNTDVSTGTMLLYLGTRDGLRIEPSLILHGPDGRGAAFAAAVAPAGDVNGDGFADVLVGANGAMSGNGRGYLYLGARDGLSFTPAAVFESPGSIGAQFGAFVSGAGDVNGDGYADVVIGATGTLNGDAYVYLGGSTVATMPHISLDGPDGPLGGFGWSVAGAGDVNHDGFDDVVIAAVCAPWTRDTDGGYPHCGEGRAYVFNGAAGTATMTPSLTLTGPSGMEGSFGWSITGVGDVNGDGIQDVVSSAYAVNNFFGAAYVYPGSAGGLPSVPAATLAGTTGMSEDFGWSVASRIVRVHVPRG